MYDPNDTGRKTRLVKVMLADGKCALNISRDHCRLEKQGNQWYVNDLGSNNGVYVDGQRLKRSEMVPLHHNSVIRLAGRKPTFEYRLESTGAATTGDQSSPSRLLQAEAMAKFRNELLQILKCSACTGLIQNAACLPCGHVFCGGCLKTQSCPVCQTQARVPLRGFAARCNPVDAIVTMLMSRESSVASEGAGKGSMVGSKRTANVWIQLSEDDEEEHEESRKKQALAKEEAENEKRCEYCAEPAHGKGVRCPYRNDKDPADSSESDVEDYV